MSSEIRFAVVVVDAAAATVVVVVVAIVVATACLMPQTIYSCFTSRVP